MGCTNTISLQIDKIAEAEGVCAPHAPPASTCRRDGRARSRTTRSTSCARSSKAPGSSHEQRRPPRPCLRRRSARSLRLLLHPLKPGVVVRELVQVRERDLPRCDGIVVGDVRRGVVEAMLELDVEPATELLDIERRRRPVDADLLADPSGLINAEAFHVAATAYASCSNDQPSSVCERFRPRGCVNVWLPVLLLTARGSSVGLSAGRVAHIAS